MQTLHEQELLDAGDQLVAHLVHPVAAAAPRPASPLHRVRTRATQHWLAASGRLEPDTARLCAVARVQATGYEPASDRGTRDNRAGRRGRTRART